MNRFQLEHILRAAGTIADVDDLVVVGSAALLGSFPDAGSSDVVGLSHDVDLFPRHEPAKADIIDAAIGEGSLFAETFQVYAHGSGTEVTDRLPAGWQERLVPVRVRGGVTGWCLSPADLAIAKLDAGRPKDLTFVQMMLDRGMTITRELQCLLDQLPDTPRRTKIAERLRQANSAAAS